MNTPRRTTALTAFLALALLAVGCATPQNGAELVKWNVEQSNPYVMSGVESEQVINVEVAAELPPSLESHIPLNLSIVIDHSGSMSGEQMNDARSALKYILSQLNDDDRISIIAFSTQVEVLLPQTEWDDADRGELDAAIGDLQPRGTTAMYQALYQAYSEVSASYDAASINRIILLSDGIPNDATNILSLAQSCRGSNIPITTMGLGPYYNEDLMAQIADTSGGNYRFIKNSDEIEKYFLAEKRAMEQVVARNVVLNFNLGPGTQLLQTLGGQGSLNGRQVSVYLGDLSVSDPRQVALKLKVKANASGSKVEILDAQLAWEDVVAWTGNHEAWAYVEAESTKDQAKIEKFQNKLVVEKVGRLHAAWELERAVRDFEAGRRLEAQERLRRAQKEYRSQKKEASAYKAQQAAEPPMAQPAPSIQMSGGATSFDSEELSIGSDDFDDYLQEVDEELEEAEPESDKGKVIIKSIKGRSRKEAGR